MPVEEQNRISFLESENERLRAEVADLKHRLNPYGLCECAWSGHVVFGEPPPNPQTCPGCGRLRWLWIN